jgi:hypothetical protein
LLSKGRAGGAAASCAKTSRELTSCKAIFTTCFFFQIKETAAKTFEFQNPFFFKAPAAAAVATAVIFSYF